jgi:hypothetical protein
MGQPATAREHQYVLPQHKAAQHVQCAQIERSSSPFWPMSGTLANLQRKTMNTLEKSAKAKRILKVLHYFSHANNIERIASNTDLICDIEAAVDDLIALIAASDPLHMEALKAAL